MGRYFLLYIYWNWYMWLSQVEIENHAGEEIFELALWPWEAREARSFEL